MRNVMKNDIKVIVQAESAAGHGHVSSCISFAIHFSNPSLMILSYESQITPATAVLSLLLHKASMRETYWLVF